MSEPFDPSEWEIIGPELTEEQLDELEKSTDRRYSTAEVIAHLENLK